MAPKISYADKLRDPSWQKKRLQIMQRDDFKCRLCRLDTKTLNVHHSYYQRGAEPWEYPDSSLLTLCEDCHQEEHAQRWNIEQILLQSLRICGANGFQIQMLAGHIIDLNDDGTFQKWIDEIASTATVRFMT